MNKYQTALNALRKLENPDYYYCGESNCDALQKLVDKEKPMEADTHQEKDYYVEDISTEVLNCPKCGAEIWNEGGYYDKPDYCPRCGQRLSYPKEDK